MSNAEQAGYIVTLYMGGQGLAAGWAYWQPQQGYPVIQTKGLIYKGLDRALTNKSVDSYHSWSQD